ncbi:hypothetical protein CEP51_015756 [Fusarium floridanum]|uniref:Uncharacterized protein n=1 Tax=Fusarium floridanum TaxID=1325733 RepID=A0A428P3K5_9HYPO|nr:hypothetical protein CEP51_015756 [Fusarium floridanum]
MSGPELSCYQSCLRYWSFNSLDVKDADHHDTTSGLAPNFSGARSYFRFMRHPNEPEHRADGSDTPYCKRGADEEGNPPCAVCSSRAVVSDHVERRLFLPHSLLLYSSENKSRDSCANLLHPDDPNLWAKEPDFYRALASDGMGFLSQVAHVCLYARLFRCGDYRCNMIKEGMQKVVKGVDAWPELSEWAFTAMSCQHHHRELWGANLTSHSGHTHIASAVAALSMVLAECSRPCYAETLFRDRLDGVNATEHKQGQNLLSQVWDLLYWMISIQYNYSVGPDQFGRWGSDMLSTSIDSRYILHGRLESDLQWLEDASVCKFRIWNFLEIGDRNEADLLAVVAFLRQYRHELGIKQKEREPRNEEDQDKLATEENVHTNCTPGFCQGGNVDSTKVKQWHKCKDRDSCEQVPFDLKLVDAAVDRAGRTAWICDQRFQQPGLIAEGNDYVAISHVWSDGTGVGDDQRDNKREHMGNNNNGESMRDDDNNSGSTVNACLWGFWDEMVGKIWDSSYKGDRAIWWDTVSIPRAKKERSMALKSLHRNYSGAKCTIVHDKFLAAMDPRNNAAVLCVALVLSNWFSRAWTALELQMSNQVYVIFGNTPIPLEKILAQSPATAHPVHWLATTMIKRLRTPIDDVGDILHILKPRSTSWPRDKTRIAALLAGVPNFDDSEDESVMTQDILKYLGKIPSLSLLHGEPTMRSFGSWSWCPSTLFHMPAAPSINVESRKMSDFLSLLDITSEGGLRGKWHARPVGWHESDSTRAFGRDSSSHLKVRLALQQRGRRYLLRPQSDVQQSEPALLVVEEKTSESDTCSIHCRYIGAVWEAESAKKDGWEIRKVTIGPPDESKTDDELRLPIFGEPRLPAWLVTGVVASGWQEGGQSFAHFLNQSPVPDESSRVGPLLGSILQGRVQSAQYQLESILRGEKLDLGMIKQLGSQAATPGVGNVGLSHIINGLWLLGDYALKTRGFSNASLAYFAAYELAQRCLDGVNGGDAVIPPGTDAMLGYQCGLAFLLSGKHKDAIPFLRKAVGGSSKRMDQLILPRGSYNAQRHVLSRKLSSYMVGQDWESEIAASYRAKRSALGALILLSVEQLSKPQDGDYDLDPPEQYFLASIRREERRVLRSSPGVEIIRFCLQGNATDYDKARQYHHGEIRGIADALKSVLEKFDTLFRKEHILCYISALCLGVASKMTADSSELESIREEYEALANIQFKRVKDELEKALPNTLGPQPEIRPSVSDQYRDVHDGVKQWSSFAGRFKSNALDSARAQLQRVQNEVEKVVPIASGIEPKGWALYEILTSHCPEPAEAATEE